MKRIVIQRPGGWDRLLLEERPDPSPGAGEVLVAAEAAGVNFADVAVRMGLYASAKKYVGWPITPGFEFAGRVLALGEGVADLRQGDEVFGVTRFGGYATHVVVPRHQLFARPARFDLPQAAGFPAIALTAYFALFELAHPRPGQTLLVHSAAGGVGSMLVQLGKLANCQVIGVVGSRHKVAAAQALGADAVIDKSSQDLWSEAERLAPNGFEAIFDANGVETLRAGYRHLASPGKLVSYGFATMMRRGRGTPDYLKLAFDWLRTPRFNPLDMTNRNVSVLAFNLSYLFERREILLEGMQRLLAWVDEGRLSVPTVTTFPLARAADAQRALESGTTVGKLVLLG